MVNKEVQVITQWKIDPITRQRFLSVIHKTLRNNNNDENNIKKSPRFSMPPPGVFNNTPDGILELSTNSLCGGHTK